MTYLILCLMIMSGIMAIHEKREIWVVHTLFACLCASLLLASLT